MSGETATHRRCAACKYLRRRCAEDCILSPYFPASDPVRFQNVHKIFGASNVSRMLKSEIRPDQRANMADTIAIESAYRVRDPVYGITGVIDILIKEKCSKQLELAQVEAQIEMYKNQQVATSPIQNVNNFGGFYHQEENYVSNEVESAHFPDLC